MSDNRQQMIEIVKRVESAPFDRLTNKEAKLWAEYTALFLSDRDEFDAIYMQALDELEDPMVRFTQYLV